MHQIAEWYNEEQQPELAIEYYNKAGERASAASSEELETECKMKAGDLMVLSAEDKFVDAIKEYEEVASRYMKVPSHRPLVKGVVLKILLLYLAIDVEFVSECRIK